MKKQTATILKRLETVERHQRKSIRLSRPILNISDAAIYLGVTKQELLALITLKSLKFETVLGKIYVNKKELDKVMIKSSDQKMNVWGIVMYLVKTGWTFIATMTLPIITMHWPTIVKS